MKTFPEFSLILLICCHAPATVRGEEQPSEESSLAPGDAIDFELLAFYPERWKKQGIELSMVPWRGKEIVFLTTTPDLITR